MLKKILPLVLLFSILFPSIFFTVSASNDFSGGDVPVKSCVGALKDVETNKKIETFRDKDADLLEEFALDLFELALNAVNINTLEQLIFGNPYCIWFDGWGTEKMVFGLYPEKAYENIVRPAFLLFTSIFAISVCISSLITGIKLFGKGLGMSKVDFAEEVIWLFLALGAISGYWIFVDILLNSNYSIVTALGNFIVNQGINISSFSLVASVDHFEFFDIIILFAEWVLLLFLNVVYMGRLLLITIFMLIGGLVIVGLLFTSTRGIFGKWLLDFTGAVFMQSVHALYFVVVIMFVSLGDLSFFFKFALLLLFLPIGTMLLNLMSFSSGLTATGGGQMLVANLARARMGKQLISRQSSKIKLNHLANANPDSLSTGATKISTLANGTNSNGWGKLTGGAQAMGSLVGGTVGLVLGGSGAALGAGVGSDIAGKSLQIPRNVTAGVKGILDTRSKIKSNDLNMDNISDKRQAYGAMGESIGVLFGNGEGGRKLGEHFSGVSKQRLMNSTELGGLGGVSLADIATKFPDSKVLFEQTNMGSGFYLQNGDDKSLISPIGQADSQLPDNFTRTVEFSPSDLNTESISNLATQDLTSLTMPNEFNMGLYQMTEAPMIRDDLSGTSVFDHSFDASSYRPEQHCNIGNVSQSVAELNSNSPIPADNQRGD